ncbi:hypothetical protein [Pseudanabaena phage PA-SR01]|nr:hypothetical protein [Pseudanabaena phage PA-SR01]
MTHFEIWYALGNESDGYRAIYKERQKLANILSEDAVSRIVELAVSFSGVPTGYVTDDNLSSSILTSELAEHLYEDLTKFRAVKLTPITRCQKCDIAYIDGVFHWNYKNQPTTPEQVLAKVCIPTTGHGDKQNIPCLAKQLYESDLGLLQKTPAELYDFVRSNNNAIELELPNEDYYLKRAKELLGDRLDEQY